MACDMYTMDVCHGRGHPLTRAWHARAGEALRAIGLRPTEEPWTVKLTGGPDGDVAGNMINILHRDYGNTVIAPRMA